MSRARTLAGITGALAIPALAAAACSPGASSGSPAPSSVALPSGLESLVPSASVAARSLPVFRPVNNSGITGGAILNGLDDQTAVTVGVVVPGQTDPMPARILATACAQATPETPPVFALNDVQAGSSSTILPVPLTELTSSPHAIAVYAAAPAASASAEPSASTVPPSASDAVPSGSPGASASAAPTVPGTPIVACADITAPGVTPAPPSAEASMAPSESAQPSAS